NGTLLVMVDLTGSPYTEFTVAKDGYYPNSQPITVYPAKDQTLDLYATLEPLPGTLIINATAGAHGSIVPSGDVAVPTGGSESFSITPARGYRIADVKVDSISVGTPALHVFSNV